MKCNSRIFSSFSGRTVLVVGGGGFLGSSLTKKLVELEANVVSLVLNRKKPQKVSENMVTVAVDLRDPISCKKVLSTYSFEYIFNAGGYIDHTPYWSGGRSVIDTHFIGTLNLLDQVAGSQLKRFVQIGSSDEYGNLKAPQNEGMREAPISPYSAAKAASTHLIQTLARTEKFPGVVARLFLGYGPGQEKGRFLPQIITGCLNNSPFPTSAGEQLRDFCYIEDVVEGLILCAVQPSAVGHVINIASGRPVSIQSVIEQVAKLAGGGYPIFGEHAYRVGENMELYADVRRSRELLGWYASTPLESGLKKTIAWYKKKLRL